MATPKRRISRTVGRQRRTHWKLDNPSIIKCGNCGAAKMPYRICKECGTYRKRKLVEVE